MDALFGGVAAMGVAALAVAMTTASGRARVVAGVGGGVVLGACCFLTFGTPTLLPLIAVLAWRADRFRWLVPATVGLAAVFATFAALGYWWIDGLDNTRHFYTTTAASHRPYWYFLFANVAVLCIALGPAVLVGLGRLGRDRGRVIVVGALASALLANLSGLSKAETERIWLLYMPWIALAAGSGGPRRGAVDGRGWPVRRGGRSSSRRCWCRTGDRRGRCRCRRSGTSAPPASPRARR